MGPWIEQKECKHGDQEDATECVFCCPCVSCAEWRYVDYTHHNQEWNN